MVKGIGPVYAKKLVEKFGEKIFDIIEQESCRLEDVDGIGPKRRQRIKDPSAIVSLTEWWRLSTVGLSFGLMVCGLGFPFAHGSRMGVLLGLSVFLGSILSAGILYWQVRRQESIAQ